MDNFYCTINFIELKAVALIFRSVWTVERSFENTIIWHKIFSIYKLNPVELFAMNLIFLSLFSIYCVRRGVPKPQSLQRPNEG